MVAKASPVAVTGPLSPFAAGFAAELQALGYTPLSAANQLRVMAHLSRWLAERGVQPGALTSERSGEFLAARRAAGYTCWLSMRGLGPLLSFLQETGVVPIPDPQMPVSAVDELIVAYRAYLVEERGLRAGTVRGYEDVARLFLSQRRMAGRGVDLEGLGAREVAEFVVAQCRGRNVGSAKLLVTSLRSLLRFLHVAGLIGMPLWVAVPAVAGWRGSGLPKALTPMELKRLLAGCDRRRLVGRRDYAILLLLARLGLRASEVAVLELDDLDWRAGDLIIRGKGNREERLPLPVDVGEAIVGYLRRGRIPVECRTLFVRARAPHGPLGAGGVKSVVREACLRAGVPVVGAHRLRHTAATQTLRGGASLPEVAQLLRHRSLSTTAIYVKVDRVALRALALPWPRGGAA